MPGQGRLRNFAPIAAVHSAGDPVMQHRQLDNFRLRNFDFLRPLQKRTAFLPASSRGPETGTGRERTSAPGRAAV